MVVRHPPPRSPKPILLPPQSPTDSPHNPPALPYFLPYIVPLLTLTLHYSPNPYHSLFPPLFVWIVIPILDLLIRPTNTASTPLTPAARNTLQNRCAFRIAVYLWCPVQLSMLLWALHRLAHGVAGVRLLGMSWSLGLIAAEGINCSHELLHRRSTLERCLAKLLLMSVLYGHFYIEHARGHHFRVATMEDPATMRFGESFYTFLPRTVVGGFVSAWRIERERVRRSGGGAWWRNEVVAMVGVQGVYCGGVFWRGGWRALALVVAVAVFAVVLLEQVNAIEHYGLRRRKVGGAYERVGVRHSWDAPQVVSSFLMFKLQVHADHHLRTLHVSGGGGRE